jgi:hypothetical protein
MFCPEEKKRYIKKRVLCFISGYNTIARYVSDKNPVIFMWLDEGADSAYPLYIEFMRKVYKTDKIEIEVIK